MHRPAMTPIRMPLRMPHPVPPTPRPPPHTNQPTPPPDLYSQVLLQQIQQPYLPQAHGLGALMPRVRLPGVRAPLTRPAAVNMPRAPVALQQPPGIPSQLVCKNHIIIILNSLYHYIQLCNYISTF